VVGMLIQLVLSLPREAGSVPLARRVLDSALRSAGVTADCRADIGLALTEACANVVAHARAADGYQVTIRAEECRCTIEVANADAAVDPQRLAQPMPEAAAESGRGLHIIRAVMDGMELAAAPAGGLLVRMVKRLDFDLGHGV